MKYLFIIRKKSNKCFKRGIALTLKPGCRTTQLSLVFVCFSHACPKVFRYKLGCFRGERDRSGEGVKTSCTCGVKSRETVSTVHLGKVWCREGMLSPSHHHPNPPTHPPPLPSLPPPLLSSRSTSMFYLSGVAKQAVCLTQQQPRQQQKSQPFLLGSRRAGLWWGVGGEGWGEGWWWGGRAFCFRKMSALWFISLSKLQIAQWLSRSDVTSPP